MKINKYAKLFKKHMVSIIYMVILFAAALTTVAFNSMNTFIKYQVSNSLYSTASTLVILYNEYEANGCHLDHLQILMDGYKQNLDIDSAIYVNGKELLSTVNSDSVVEKYDENIEDQDIVDELKNNGICIRGDADVNGNGYYNCSMALYDQNGEYIGAIFVGKDVDLIASALRGRQMIYIVFMWALSIIFISAICVTGARRYSKYIELGKSHNNKKGPA